MNRHHPYGSYESHRGGPQGGPGPDRSHRGGNRGRGGFSRGRGGGGGYYNGAGGGGGYDGNMSYNAYDQAPDAAASYSGYEQQNANYFNNNGYGTTSSSQYGAGGFNQGYSKFEDGPGTDEDTFGRMKKQVRKDRDDKVHDSIIEERIQRERPCRTLFIRNIKYETNSADVRRQFEEHGDIRTFFDLISTRGMVFVTYYDLRAAERARERLQGSEISGRPIDVHYSLPRDDRDNERNMQFQGCLQVTLKNSLSGMPVDDNEVRRKFQQFGDVKSIQSVGDRIDSRYVEYYDTRACDEAYDRLRHQGLQDGVMDIVFAWDVNEGGAQGSQRSICAFFTSCFDDVLIFNHRRGNRGGGSNSGGGDGDYNEWDDGGRRGRGARGGRGRGRGRGNYEDDFDRGGSRDRDQRGRGRYDDDYGARRSGGGGGGPNNSYNDRYDRGTGYGPGAETGGGYSVPTFSQPPPPTPPAGMAAASPATTDDRLEQARKVQQLLAALKQPAGGPAPSNLPPTGNMPGMPSSMQAPPSGGPGFYSQPPPTASMVQPPFSSMMPPYGVPPPASSSTPQPPSAASVAPPAALSGLPPNILALIQSAQQGSGPVSGVPLPGMSGPPPPGASAYGMPPPPMMGSSPANGSGAPINYQQFMPYLQPAKRP
ncbi:uncharacterized protein C8R40DRAFT_22447 [Lentinula edodes]|uniref:uncharacterized protein n=1 Tax=Lentinula edodes TaxID=5353 RepID=UPI001E8DF453|nr:uncharacterized protein C8R40DRAFT_22447 [Lentinula edodes]KAH7881176.1 hypothetical protein C8R40DRAFT_22447 [Lentinula edodes]